MTGRQKTCMTKVDLSPTRPEETKEASLPTCHGKTLTEDKQNGSKETRTKNKKKENPNNNGDTPTSSQQHAKSKNRSGHVTGSGKQPRTPNNEDTEKSAPDSTSNLEEQSSEKTTSAKGEPVCQEANLFEQSSKVEIPQQGAQNDLLEKTLKKLEIRKNEQLDVSQVINSIVEKITAQLKRSQHFNQVGEPLCTGSYYEDLKISHPDEFDVMVPIPVPRVTIKPFGDKGSFYSVGLKRDKIPLKEIQSDEILSASEVLIRFRNEVKKSIKDSPEWNLPRKKKGCPAVTMTKTVGGVKISLDVVPCLHVKSSWPAFTHCGLQIKSWLGAKQVKKYRRDEPYYLVPKYEGRGTVEIDGVSTRDVWRISFSHIEKRIIDDHGSLKNCCKNNGQRCCRKECLKLLKHLLCLLKESDSSLDKIYSYHAKTTLLHACCSRPANSHWASSDLDGCFQRLLKDFEGHLETGQLSNFFIPKHNLLAGVRKKHRIKLARRIRKEREQGFPIFRE